MRTLGCLTLLMAACVLISGCNKSVSPDSTSSLNSAAGSSSLPGEGSAKPSPVSKNRVMVSSLSDASLSPAQLDYLLALQEKLSTGWRPLSADHRYSVSVGFTLSRPGLCMDVRPITATGGQRAIERTMDSVRACSPFPAVPEEFKEVPIEFRCDFVYFPEK